MGGEALCQLIVYSLSLKEVMVGAQARTLRRKHERMLPPSCITWAYAKLAFLHSQGNGAAHSGLGPLTSLTNKKKSPTNMPTSQPALDKPSHETSFSLTLGYFKLMGKAN